MKHFATKYNGTMIALFDEDSRQIGGEYTIESITDIEAWAASESLYGRDSNGEVWVKLQNKNGDFEAMSMTDANEMLGEEIN